MNTPETDLLQSQLQPIDPLALLGIDAAVIGLFLLASSIGTLLFFILIIINSIRNWKMQKAIFELQKDVREMNERQKQKSSSTQQTATDQIQVHS